MEQLSKDFLARIPVSKLDWKHIEELFDQNVEDSGGEILLQIQKKILKATVLHPLSLRHPLPCNYIHAFLKTLISKIEKYNCEIHHRVLEVYTEQLSKTREESGYRTYLIDDKIYVTLRENVNIISDGTTGLYTWQAAFYLAEWVIANTEVFSGKRVLELGAGSGLVGLVASKACRPLSITFTDCHRKVLAALSHNIETNRENDPPILNENRNFDSGAHIAVRELDWLEFSGKEDLDDHELEADVILASDVVYDVDVIPALVRTLFKLLSPEKRNGSSQPVAVLACTIRNEETNHLFLSEIGKLC